MSRIAALATLVILAACATSNAERSVTAADPVHIDDSAIGRSLDHIAYEGRWDHISGMRDGRDAGTSSRSRIPGDNLVLPFDGEALRIYGVRGPNGGDAAVAIDGTYYGTVSFYARHKQVHVLVFESPQLVSGTHVLAMVVKGAQPKSHRGFANIDEFEVLKEQ
jgi:hypothetical protein